MPYLYFFSMPILMGHGLHKYSPPTFCNKVVIKLTLNRKSILILQVQIIST